MTIEERYEKETGESWGADLDGQCYYNDGFVTWLKTIAEKHFTKLTKKEKPKATLFRDSEWFDYEKFAMHMGSKFSWDTNKSGYYYQSMLDWSDGITSAKKTPQTAIDWVRTALAWERKEKFGGTGYYKNNKAESRVAKDLETMKRMSRI